MSVEFRGQSRLQGLLFAFFLLLVTIGNANSSGFDLSPITKSDWTFEHAKHLLERAGFGATYQETNRVYELGPKRAVRLILKGGAVERRNRYQKFEHSGIFENSLEPFPPSRPALTSSAKITGEALGIQVREGVNRPLQPIVNKFFYWAQSQPAGNRSHRVLVGK